ncbi:MAG: hypothetical protein K2X04_02055 [Burkholderiales bacterium]|nr:hypothetical protein [Burkholderiales bacterium]
MLALNLQKRFRCVYPVYLSDVIKDKLPDRAMVAYKDEKEWRLVDESYNFMFSLYSNDLVKIATKKEIIFGYYISANRATAALQEVLHHDGSRKYNGVGIQSATIEKYQVDVLGNIRKIDTETRLDFSQMKTQK